MKKVEDVLSQTVGSRLRSARQAVGWSQSELARRAGVLPATISRIEGSKRRNPRFETIRQIEGAFRAAGYESATSELQKFLSSEVARELGITPLEREQLSYFVFWLEGEKPTLQGWVSFLQARRSVARQVDIDHGKLPTKDT